MEKIVSVKEKGKSVSVYLSKGITSEIEIKSFLVVGVGKEVGLIPDERGFRVTKSGAAYIPRAKFPLGEGFYKAKVEKGSVWLFSEPLPAGEKPKRFGAYRVARHIRVSHPYPGKTVVLLTKKLWRDLGGPSGVDFAVRDGQLAIVADDDAPYRFYHTLSIYTEDPEAAKIKEGLYDNITVVDKARIRVAVEIEGAEPEKPVEWWPQEYEDMFPPLPKPDPRPSDGQLSLFPEQYSVFYAKLLPDLEVTVSKALTEGWNPQGGVLYANGVFYQAAIR